MPILNLLIDFDDTLYPLYSQACKFFNEIYRVNNPYVPERDFIEGHGSFDEIYGKYEKLGDGSLVLKKPLDREVILTHFNNLIFSEDFPYTAPLPGAVEVLNRLKVRGDSNSIATKRQPLHQAPLKLYSKTQLPRLIENIFTMGFPNSEPKIPLALELGADILIDDSIKSFLGIGGTKIKGLLMTALWNMEIPNILLPQGITRVDNWYEAEKRIEEIRVQKRR